MRGEMPSKIDGPLEPYTVADAWEWWRKAAVAWDAELAKGNQPSETLVRHAFATASGVLRAYCRPANWVEKNGPSESLPIQLAHLIANQIDYIVAGQLPEPIRQLTQSRGRPEPGPQENTDKGIAVAYIRAAREGLIDDARPVKTVEEEFGAHERTVLRWLQRLPWVTPRDFYPNASDAEHGQRLSEGMRKAGARHREAGRTAPAISRRAGKRKADKGRGDKGA